MATSLMELVDADYKTTLEADAINTKLMAKLGLRTRYEPARLAIARSLSITEEPPNPTRGENDEDGKVIKGRNLFGVGEDLSTWIALIVEHARRDDTSRRDIQDLVGRHWHRGAHLLWNEWVECGEDFDKFVLRLAERAGVREGEGDLSPQAAGVSSAFKPKAVPVIVRIGNPSVDVATRQPVSWVLNGRGVSPHVALMGTLGTGKTRTGMDMLRAVRQQAGCPILLFDMEKGDLAGDANLARDLGATVVRAKREPVPLDVLHAGERDESAVNDASIRFRESFARVMQNKPGGAQLDALRDGARRALMNAQPTKIVDVRDKVKEVYAENKRRDDVVIATFNDLTLSENFVPRLTPDEFFKQSWIIDVSAMNETSQRLIVFLVLDALDAYCKSLIDSEVDEHGHRALRLVFGVDEARKILGYEQQSLISVIRTGRSKGISAFLISQSPDDYDGEDENFLENIGLAVCFRTNARSTALNAVLGQSVDLAGLSNGVCVTRLPDRPGVTRVRAWE
jgi:DNA sulfur modification protein DndE